MNTVSYSKLERRLGQTLRDRLNHAESGEDVKKFFFYTVRGLISKGLNGLCQIEPDDVVLTPNQQQQFSVSSKIRENQDFSSLWDGSDMPAIVKRFARQSSNRYRHMEGHPEKTQLKIRAQLNPTG